jgi:hypothetical protein
MLSIFCQSHFWQFPSPPPKLLVRRDAGTLGAGGPVGPGFRGENWHFWDEILARVASGGEFSKVVKEIHSDD